MMTSRLQAAFFQNDQAIAEFTFVRFEQTAVSGLSNPTR